MQAFSKAFDNICHHGYLNGVIKFHSYNYALIDRGLFDFYQNLATVVFPKFWWHLSNLSNTKCSSLGPTRKLIKAKESQVFLQILMLKRMHNPHSLVWWFVIQAMAYYGWGVG